MSSGDYIVPARSWADIDQIGASLLNRFGLSDEPTFPVIDFMETVLDHRLGLTNFIVGEPDEMKSAEGFTDPGGEFVMLREDVYLSGLAGQGRARFTAAHELGHFVLHTNIPLARVQPGQDVKPYRLAEPQANQFASAVLMPVHFFSPTDTVELVMERHGVSRGAATTRLKYLRNKGII